MKHLKLNRQTVVQALLGGMAFGAFALPAAAQPPATPATIVVGPDCTLINAIRSANSNADTGGCVAVGTYNTGGQPDTIELTASVELTAAQPATFNGLPQINDALIIRGNGHTISRAATAPRFRILQNNLPLTLDRVTISGGFPPNNEAGGGIRAVANLTLTNSTISGNTAVNGNGGGLSAESDNLTIVNSTISGNSGLAGGGIAIGGFGTTVTITNSTVTANAGGGLNLSGMSILTLRNTIVAGNTVPEGSPSPSEIGLGGGSFTPVLNANANNLFGHSGVTAAQAFSGFTPGASDINATSSGDRATALASILNTTLAANAGTTFTHALVAGSPAINASGANATPADQRGVAANGLRDIGAYEFVPPVVAIDGACGTANNTASSRPAEADLCAAGNHNGSLLGDKGMWGWQCFGTHGGGEAACGAPYGTQTLSISADPGTIEAGQTAAVSAQSTSGLKPTLSSITSTACSLGAQSDTATGVTATATGSAAGTCSVKANHPGTGDSGDYRFQEAEEVSTSIRVTAPAVPVSACDAYRGVLNVNVIDLRASPGGQTVRGNTARFNVIYGSGFADTITGGNAGNCIDGGAGADRITAGSGENWLYGDAGNDSLTPGGSSTAMDGGAGTDRCGRTSGRATATYASCELN